MALDTATLAAARGYTELALFGITNVTVDNVNKAIIFEFLEDGSQHILQFDQPLDGLSIIAVDVVDGKLVCTLSDGSTLNAGTIPTVKGDKGDDGKSAYKIWLEAGNTGTEEDFLNSLKGEPGDPGEPGENGKSAYEAWLDAGNTGSEEDFLNSLKGADGTMSFEDLTEEQKESLNGEDGKSAYQIWLDLGNTGTEQDFINSLGSGGVDTLVITGNYSTDDEDNWSVSNIDKTFSEINEAITNNQDVVLRIYPEGDTTNPYILHPTMHYSEMGTAFSLAIITDGEGTGLNVMITKDNTVTASMDSLPLFDYYNKDEADEKFAAKEDLESLAVTDVLEYTLGYTCKNLIPNPYGTSAIESRGITFTPNADGTVSYTGIANDPTAAFYTFPTVMCLPAGSYKITGGNDIYGGVGVLLYDDKGCTVTYTGGHEGLLTISTTSVYIYNTLDGTVNWNKDTNPYGYEKEFTIDKPAYVKVQARSANNSYTEEVSGIIYPMVRFAGIEDATWEQYKPSVDERLNNVSEIIYTDLSGNLAGITTVLDLVNALLEEYRIKRKNVRFECGSISNTTLTDLPQAYGYLTIKVGGTNIVEITFAYSNLGFKSMYYGFLNRATSETLYSELNWEEIPTKLDSVPIIEDGNTVIQHKITKNKDITDLPISTDRSGNKLYSTDELYLTYEFEELVDAFEQWFVDKGITPERGMTYDDIEQLSFYIPAGGGYGYVNTYFKFDNTAYMVYCLKYQDVEYIMFQMSYDHTNKKIYRNQRYGLNVINFGKIIPDLTGSSVQSDILEVLHNWFQVYKPIGLDNAKGVPLTSNYDKQAASLSQDELVSVTYGNNQGAYDLGNGVSLMTSPLQRLLLTLNKEGTELRAYANNEGKATAALSAGFFDGGNLLQAKNTFKKLEDMSSPPIPTIGTFGVYTVTPDAPGQPEGLTKGGTLITAYITGDLYSQTVNYIGTRIAIFFTEGAMYYTLGLGGKYYPTSSWTSPIKWNKITTTLV